jgi:hypothetical protein
MKRILLPVLASALVALFAPAVASAHHHHHHARSHRHASSARVLNFGAASLAGAVGTTAPTQASSPTENAGTVESFENGVLKIKLNDGTVVPGKVTEDTELRCERATPPETNDDQESGDDEGDQGDSSPQGQLGSRQGDFLARSADIQDSSGGDDNDQGDNGDRKQESCVPAAALTHGAIVREAELELTGAGAVWEKVVIVK